MKSFLYVGHILSTPVHIVAVAVSAAASCMLFVFLRTRRKVQQAELEEADEQSVQRNIDRLKDWE